MELKSKVGVKPSKYIGGDDKKTYWFIVGKTPKLKKLKPKWPNLLPKHLKFENPKNWVASIGK